MSGLSSASDTGTGNQLPIDTVLEVTSPVNISYLWETNLDLAYISKFNSLSDKCQHSLNITNILLYILEIQKQFHSSLANCKKF